MSNMFNGFGELDFSGIDEEAPDTVPLPGTATLKVEDKCEALFITADWVIVAKVGELELGRSTRSNKAHTAPFLARWTRQLIRQNKERLRRLGVDVPATYLQWGGILEDLEPAP